MADIPLNLDLSTIVASAKVNLPAPAKELLYVPSLKRWGVRAKMPKKDVEVARTDFSFVVEKAKSAASGCRRCGEKIAKLEFRFGYFTSDPRGEYGAIVVWFHLSCIPIAFLGFETIASLLPRTVGLIDLSDEELNAIKTTELKQFGASSLIESELKEVVKKVILPNVPAPPELRATLLPFQAEGLAWLVSQELGAIKGGILADELGLGKTLQCISLILKRRQEVRTTLVVCPVSTVLQWYTEIEKFSAPGTLKVHVYHSQHKLSAAELLKFDVVLTTYQTLEIDYRKQVNKLKSPCEYCGKLFLKDKLVLHLKYFCGPDAVRTARQAKQQASKKAAIAKGLKTLGIGANDKNEQGYRPPTVSNLVKEIAGRLGSKAAAAESESSAQSESSAASEPSESESGSFISSDSDSSVPAVKVQPKAKAQAKAKAKAKAKASPKPQAKKGGKRKREELSELSDESEVVVRRPRTRGKQRDFRAMFETSDEDGENGGIISSNGGSRDEQKKEEEQKVKIGLRMDGIEKKTLAELRTFLSSLDPGMNVHKLNKSALIAAIKIKSEERLTKKKEEKVESEYSESDGSSSFISSDDEEDDSSQSDSSVDSDGSSDSQTIDLSQSPLHAISWGRVILDEAHRIKGRTNSTAQAALALDAEHRIACTGTPLANRVGELYSLLRFLRFDPYAFYFCKTAGCECKSLEYAFKDNKYCVDCGHTKMQHFSYFRQTISNPIIKFGFAGAGQEALRTLRREVLDQVLLRRTKAERKDDLNLPPMSVVIRKQPMSEEEMDFYQALYSETKLKFDKFADAGTLMNNYAHIFDLLTKLRQASDHPYLLLMRGAGPAQISAHTAAQASNEVTVEEEHSCVICGDVIAAEEEENFARATSCSHVFHRDCVEDFLETAPQLAAGGVGCPVCFAKLNVVFGAEAKKKTKDKKGGAGNKKDVGKVSSGDANEQGIQSSAGQSGSFRTSTKLEMLADEVMGMLEEDETNKVLVFSQFTRMLTLAEERLRKEGVQAVRLAGDMTLEQRNNLVVAFNRDPSLRVLLISLKCGAEGINLQIANRVVLTDPWWSPALEMQACQRAHRIGQFREVKCVRLIVEKTIEEKILELQEKKLLVFEGTVGQSTQALDRLTQEDLAFLFQQ